MNKIIYQNLNTFHPIEGVTRTVYLKNIIINPQIIISDYTYYEIVAYAHIQFLPDKRAAIRIIATSENKRNQSFGSRFLVLMEKWLRSSGVKSIHEQVLQNSLRFYLKNGYTSMPFDDPEGHESDSDDVPVVKLL